MIAWTVMMIADNICFSIVIFADDHLAAEMAAKSMYPQLFVMGADRAAWLDQP